MANPAADISAVILAGGRNSRYGGRIKASLQIKGKTLIDSILETVKPLFEEVIIVTNSPEAYSQYKGIKITGDILKNVGPLGGLHAGLSACSTKAAFLFASDMPSLSGKLIFEMCDMYRNSDYEVLMPRTGTGIEPLHSIYSSGLFEKLAGFLDSSRKLAIRDFLPKTKVEYFDPAAIGFNSNVFFNINTPGDLEKFEKR